MFSSRRNAQVEKPTIENTQFSKFQALISDSFLIHSVVIFVIFATIVSVEVNIYIYWQLRLKDS